MDWGIKTIILAMAGVSQVGFAFGIDNVQNEPDGTCKGEYYPEPVKIGNLYYDFFSDSRSTCWVVCPRWDDQEVRMLREIAVPEYVSHNGKEYTVESIWREAFKGFGVLEKISLPSNLKYLSDYAFQDCTALREINFPPSLKLIYQYAFCGCAGLKNVAFPASLIDVSKYAFSNSGVQNVEFASDCCLREDGLGIGAFSNCKELRSMNLPDGLKIIPSRLCDDCPMLEEVTFPASITEIGTAAFWRTGIREINIPAGVEKIKSWAFEECGNLSKVSFGMESPTSARLPLAFSWGFVFDGCQALTQIEMNSFSPPIILGSVFDSSHKATVWLPEGYSKRYGEILEYENVEFNTFPPIVVAECPSPMNIETCVDVVKIDGVNYGIFAYTSDYFYVEVVSDVDHDGTNQPVIEDRAFADNISLRKLLISSPVKARLEGTPFAGMECTAPHLYVPRELVEEYEADPGWQLFTVLPLEAVYEGLEDVFTDEGKHGGTERYSVSGFPVPPGSPGIVIEVDPNGGKTAKRLNYSPTTMPN